MPVLIEVKDGKGILLLSSGIVTGQEFLEISRNLVSKHNQGLRYAIVDITDFDGIHASTAEIRTIALENKRLAEIAEPGMRVAIAAQRDIAFGLARMWEAFASHDTGWRISVFRSRSEADAWVHQDIENV